MKNIVVFAAGSLLDLFTFILIPLTLVSSGTILPQMTVPDEVVFNIIMLGSFVVIPLWANATLLYLWGKVNFTDQTIFGAGVTPGYKLLFFLGCGEFLNLDEASQIPTHAEMTEPRQPLKGPHRRPGGIPKRIREGTRPT